MRLLRNPPSSRLAVVIAAVWMLGTLLFDANVGDGLVRQVRSGSYPMVLGTITRSTVSVGSEEEEGAQEFSLRYTYEVDGREYEGHRYRYVRWSSMGSEVVDDLRKRFPVGATVPVFYRPDHPSDSVLQQGVKGFDLLLLMFMAPFNLLMVALVYSVARSWNELRPGSAFVRKGRVHVRLAASSPLVMTLFKLVGVSVVLPIVVGLLTGFDPSLATMGAAWGVLLVMGVFLALRHPSPGPDELDLILDEKTGRLSLPAIFGRSERLDVEWSQVRSVTLEKHTEEDGEGNILTTWRPTLVFTNARGELQREILTVGHDEDAERELVAWLRSRLSL